MFSSTSLLDPFFSTAFLEPRVLVISDSEHRKLQQQQVLNQVAVLEQRAEQQQRQLTATLDAIADLKKQLPTDSAAKVETTDS